MCAKYGTVFKHQHSAIYVHFGPLGELTSVVNYSITGVTYYRELITIIAQTYWWHSVVTKYNIKGVTHHRGLIAPGCNLIWLWCSEVGGIPLQCCEGPSPSILLGRR